MKIQMMVANTDPIFYPNPHSSVVKVVELPTEIIHFTSELRIQPSGISPDCPFFGHHARK
jgi:hypothetical protein